jgi:transposase
LLPLPVNSASTVRRSANISLAVWNYGPRPCRQKSTDPFLSYLRERLAAFPGLTAVRLWREMRECGYPGGYTAVKRAVRDIRPDPITPFEVRFETPPREQAQVDLARFEVEFTDEPGATRIVWLFSMGARLFASDLGAVRRPPGSAVGSALPHRRARGDRRRTARDNPHDGWLPSL